MIFAPRISSPRPPRLSMDEYLDFVEATIKDCDPRLAARQKNLEKQITKPFRMTPSQGGGRGSHTGLE